MAGGAHTSALMNLGQDPDSFETRGTITPQGYNPYLIYTIKVTSKENSSYTSEIKLTLVDSSGATFTEKNSGDAPSVGDTFVIRNRLGGENTPWYAICIKDNNQIGFGYCSVKRSNAVKLARGTMSPSGGSDAKTRTYTIQHDQYCLNEGIKALGANADDCKFVIQGDKLLYYFIGTVEFEKVASDKIDLD